MAFKDSQEGGDFSFLDQPSGEGSASLGYAANLDKQKALEVYKNGEFIQDIMDYYGERDGITFSSNEEAYDKFWTDRTWRNLNTFSIGADYLDGKSNTDAQNIRLARLQSVHTALPDFWQEGGNRDAGHLADIAGSVILDPINAIGFGAGGAAAKTAAFTAIRSGLSKEAAKSAGRNAAMKKGFVAEGAANALVEGVANVGIQNRDIEIGLRGEYNPFETATASAMGFALGGALGVPMGLGGAYMPAFTKAGRSGSHDWKTSNKLSQGMREGKKARFQDKLDAASNEVANEIVDEVDDMTASQILRGNVIARAKQDYDKARAETAEQNGGLDLEKGDANNLPDGELSTWSNLEAASARVDHLAKASHERKASAQQIAPEDPAKANDLMNESQKLAEASNAIQDAFNRMNKKYEDGLVPTEKEIETLLLEDQRAQQLLIGSDPNVKNPVDPKDAVIPGARPDTQLPDGSAVQDVAPKTDPVAVQAEARQVEINKAQTDVDNTKASFEAGATKVNNASRKLTRLTGAYERSLQSGVPENVTSAEQALRVAEEELDVATGELEVLTNNAKIAEDALVAKKSEELKAAPDQDTSPEVVAETEATATGNKVVEEPQSAEEIVDELVNSTDPDEKINFTSLKSTLNYIVDELGFTRAEVINSLPKAKKGRPTNADKEAFRSAAIQFTERAMVQQQAQNAIEELTSPEQFFDFNLINVILDQAFTDPRLRAIAQDEYLSAISNQTPTYIANLLSENPKLKMSEILIQAEDYYGKEVADIMAASMKSDVIQKSSIDMDKLIGKKAAIGNMTSNIKAMNDTIFRVSELRKAILGKLTDQEFKRGYGQVTETKKIRGQENLTQAQVNQIINNPNFKGQVDTYSSFSFQAGSGSTPQRAVANDAEKQVQEIAKSNGINPDLNSGEIIEQLEMRVRKLENELDAGVRTPIDMTKPQGSTLTKAEFAQLSEKQQIMEVFVSRLPKGKVEQINAMREQLIKANIADGTITPEMAVSTADLAVERMIENMMKRDELLGQVDGKGKSFSSNQSTRGMQDASVADQYADNAPHMGKTYESGFGKISIGRNKTMTGGSASKRVQKILRSANRVGLNDGAVFRKHGIVKGESATVSFQEAALQELEQSFIDNATNRVVRSDEKIKDNKVEFDNADNAIKEANKLNAQIKKLDKEIDENPGAENVPQLEKDVQLLNQQVTKIYEDAIAKAPDYAAEKGKLNQLEPTLRGTVLEIRKEFSQETAKEAAGRKAENRKSSPVGKVQVILNELKNHQTNIVKAKKRGRSKPIMDALYSEKKEIYKRYNAEFKKLSKSDQKRIKEANKKVATQTAAEIEIRQRAKEQEVADIKIDEVPEWYGLDDITPEERVGIIEDSQKLADQNNKSQAAEVEIKQKAQAVLSNDLPKDEMVRIILELKSELDAIKNGVPPTKAPTGTQFKPYIRKIDGYEVDVHNHFKFEGKGGEGFLVFDGVRVAQMGKIGDKVSLTLITDKASSNDIRLFSNSNMMKDNIPEIFKNRIAEYAERTGAIIKTEGEEGLQFKQEWNKSETYKGRAEADAEDLVIDDPTVETSPISDPKNVMTHTANDYQVPPGRKMAIQIVDDVEGSALHGVVRIPNPNQTIGQVLKTSSNKKFIIGHVKIDRKIASGRRKKGMANVVTPASLAEAMEDFTPLTPSEGKVTYQEGQLLLGNKTVADKSPRKRAMRPVKVEDLGNIKVKKSFLPNAVADKIDNAADLQAYINNLENISWSRLGTLADVKRFTNTLKQAYAAMGNAVPNGVKRIELDQRQSFKTLRNVFKGRADDEIEASLDFLRRINPDGSNGAMPRFEGVDGIEGDANAVGAYNTNDGKILLTDKLFEKGGDEQLRPIPATITVVHEVGHWAYDNMLTPSEKMMFWHSMSKYYDADGNLDMELLQKRLPGISGNEIESPAELFAHQFTSYALNIGAVPDAALFIKVARHAVTLIERFVFGKHPMGIQSADPDLEALFERIIPRNQFDADGSVVHGASRFAGLEENGYTVSPTAGFIGRQLNELDNMRSKLTSVMNVSIVNDVADTQLLLKTLEETGKNIYSKFGGGQGKTHHYTNKATGEGGNQRVRLLDGQVTNKQEVVTGDGSTKLVNIYNYPAARRARNRLLNAQSAIRDYMKEVTTYEASTKTSTDDAELRQLIASQQMDMEDAMPDNSFIEMDEMELANVGSSWEAQAEVLSRQMTMTTGNLNFMHIRRLAGDMLNAIDDGQRELVKAFNRNMPRDDMSRQVSIDFQGNASITQPSIKGRKKKMGDAIQLRQEKQLADDLKELETESVLLTQVGNDALLSAIRNGDPKIFMDSLAETNPVIKKSVKQMTDAELNAEKKRTNYGDKRKVDLALEASARKNASKNVNQEEAEIVSDPAVQKAINNEVAQTAGTDSIAGIPAKTPQPIKDFLRGLTNGDKVQEAVGQNLIYRLLNVGGHTIDDFDTGFVPESIMEGIFTQNTVPKRATGEPASLKDQAYNGLRKELRAITKSLSGKGDMTPRDMEIMSDLAFHLSMSDATKAKFVSNMRTLELPSGLDSLLWLRQAMVYKAEGNLAELQRHVRVFEVEDGFYKIPANPKAQELMRIVNRHFETIAYSLNGNFDPDKLPLQLMSYGDMFASQRIDTGISSAVDGADKRFVNKHVVQDYAVETVDKLHQDKEIIARSFLGVSREADLKNHTYIHSGQDGMNTQIHKTEVGEYGPGYYMQTLSEFNSKSSADLHNRGADDLIKSSSVSDNLKQKSLMANRKLTDVNIAIDALSMEKKMATPARKNEIVGTLQNLVKRANSLQTIINRTATVNLNSDVVPVFSNPRNMFNFSRTAIYDFVNPSDNNIAHIIADMGEKGLISVKGVQKLQEVLDGSFTGSDFFRALTDENVGVMHKHGDSVNSFEAKTRLNEYLEDAGYEGSVHSNKNSETVIVNYNSETMKPINGEFTEAELNNTNQGKSGGDIKPTGDLLIKQLEEGEAFDPTDFVGFSAQLQRSSLADPVVRVVRRMAKKQPLEEGDLQRASKFSTVKSWFTENSIRFRDKGAHWYGNLLKPKNGIGIFEKHSVDLAGKINPIFSKLEELPDAKGRISKWMGKNSGLIGKGVPVPDSHKRIVNALRAGNLAVLKQGERKIAQQIANAFTKELNDMRAIGIKVGDVTQGGRNGYYFPQVWDVEAIRENPNAFINGLLEMFVREQNSPDFEGTRLTRDEILTKAKNLQERMVDNEGVADESLVHTAISDPFSRRMLTLKPEEMKGMRGYLVNDLQGILAKYFDRSTRKIALSEKFGVEGHGFDAYKSIADLGDDAAVTILSNAKLTVSKFDSMGAKIDTGDTTVPKINKSFDEIKELIGSVKKALAGNPQQNMVQAKNILINAIDVTQRTNPQFLVRVDAVVNALADFQGVPQRKGLISDLESMNKVLNKRPISGEGHEFSHQFTRRLKTFNAVSLLGFTTLTSMPDLTLPLIRSGNLGAFAKAWKQYSSNPAYRAAAKNIGVGIENLMHDRMVQMAGEGNQKFSNSFFNATLLTDWTNFNRQMASMVGMEAFRSEIANAIALRQKGAQNSKAYETSQRFLERYGLTGENAEVDYLAPGAPRIDMPTENLAQRQAFKYAAMRFTNEAIFTPNPNDIPMWAQTPWGSLMFQLKSFPLMMGRMSKDVLSEAKAGNFKPLIYLATAGIGIGAASAGVKDLVQGRGEDSQGNKIREFRDRKATDSISYIASLFGIEEDGDTDKVLGWYIEGLMAIGGLGLFAEMLYNSSAQLDNGKYGFVRTMSAIAGPGVSAAEDILFDIPAGAKDFVTGDGTKTGQRREMFRSIAGRLPVLGGLHGFREGAADLGGKKGGNKKTQSKFGKVTFATNKGFGN